MRFVFAALLACAASPAISAADALELRTLAERSGYERTGRYEEVERLCASYERAFPEAVRCEIFGRSPEGRPMHVLVATRQPARTPEAARAAGVPVVLFQGGIHAGEIDGKDAGFLALREMLQGRAARGALERLVVLFVPVFNVDGHERFGRWNRPNQRGPEEMGFRVTAQSLNLNRDYLKADAPEMHAMLRLVAAWDPIAYVDLHATDGAQFEHDVSVQVEPLHSGDDGLRRAGRALRDDAIAKLRAQGSKPLPFYPSFVVSDDPASGFDDGVAPPRFSTGYFPLRNRFGMLVETHSWRPYPERVRTTRNLVVAVAGLARERGREWLALARAADAAAAKLAGAEVPLDYTAVGEGRMIEFAGYRYTRTPSEVSGALMTRYDESTPQTWRVRLRDDVQPKTVVRAPRGGYVVPAAHAAWVAAHLDLHAIEYRALGRASAAHPVEVFHATKATFDPGPFEGRQRVALEGEWKAATETLGAGALFVPIAQPKARLVVALFEPKAPDAYAAWGRFNAHFERKEYMEDYVAEQVAREALAKDPALAAEFHARLGAEPEFAKSPGARLEFFYRRHPSWDQRYMLYPVVRVAEAP